MKYLVTLLSFIVFVPVCAEIAYSQETSAPGVRSTSAPAGSRYEIVAVSSRVKAVLKLDKYSGEVFELAKNKALVRNKDEGYSWRKTKRLPHADADDAAASGVNYQVYSEGAGGLYTYLLNLRTGATWVLAREEDKEGLYWYPLKHQ